MPDLFLVCGPNGAGKSTWTKGLASKLNIVCIDPDALSANGLTPIAAGKAAATLTKTLIAQNVSFARESTLTSRFDFKLIDTAKAAGYRVHLIYIRLDTVETALSRVACRVRKGGHDVPENDIRRRFERSLENLALAMKIVDSYIILNNSGQEYILERQG